MDQVLLRPTGLAVPVEPQRGQIMHISLGEVDTSRWPVLLPGAGGHYMLAFDGGRIVAGATRETGSGFDYRITPGGLAEILEQALAVAPGLAGGTYTETRVGFRPWALASGRCSDRCRGWTAWSSPPAWAPRG